MTNTYTAIKNLTVKQLIKQELKELSNEPIYNNGTKVSNLTEQQLIDIADHLQERVRESLKYIALNKNK